MRPRCCKRAKRAYTSVELDVYVVHVAAIMKVSAYHPTNTAFFFFFFFFSDAQSAREEQFRRYVLFGWRGGIYGAISRHNPAREGPGEQVLFRVPERVIFRRRWG